MMRWVLFAALLAAPELHYPPHEDAGISFFQTGKLLSGERIRFRAEGGAGWDEMPLHVGPRDRGMYDHPLYDQHLSPGGMLTIETSLTRRDRRIAHVRMKLKVEADRRYFVYAAVQPNDPTRGCMGCIGAKSVRIPGERSRRLWVYYSFNGISHPIIF